MVDDSLDASGRRPWLFVAAVAVLVIVVIGVAALTRPRPDALQLGTTNPATGWTTLPSYPVHDRQFQPQLPPVWTGHEVILPGVLQPNTRREPAESLAFDPATSTWRVLPPAPGPFLLGATISSVWTGEDLILLTHELTTGSEDPVGQPFATAYRPSTNAWRTLARPTALDVAVWTGDRVLAWSGGVGVASYDPQADTWTPLTTETQGGPDGSAPRVNPGFSSATSAAWDGRSLVVASYNTVARFDPLAAQWTSIPAPFPVSNLVHADSGVVAFDGESGRVAVPNGTEGWTERTPSSVHNRVVNAAWVSGRLVVWGGTQFDYSPGSAPPQRSSDGEIWDPPSDTWSTLIPLPAENAWAVSVSLGDRLFVVGVGASGAGTGSGTAGAITAAVLTLSTATAPSSDRIGVPSAPGSTAAVAPTTPPVLLPSAQPSRALTDAETQQLRAALIGRDEATATRLAEAAGWTVRVVERDGVGFAVTQDFRPDRLDLTIDQGQVTAVDVG